MKAHVAQCQYLLSLSESILADLDDSHRAIEPHAGLKTAGWLIGHLAVTGDFARRLCGRKPPLCPVEWRAKFAPGSQPSSDASDYPTMQQLREAFRGVYSSLCAAALEAETSTLAAPNPYAPAQAGFPTAGDFVAYLLTGHLAYHLGQLVAWRAGAGFGRLQRPDVLAA